MAWEHLTITKPHLVYIILGGFTSLFMLCSSIIKERLYIGEATVATICGLIFGPHALGWINPASWGNVDLITIEFSRIVLVVQCFAVGVELPKFYMEKHWKSVFLLLVPVMTWGWMITSLVIWWIIPDVNWLDGLLIAACITATDPVLASSVVGKGKFAKRVPKHLRDLLSAESGCNDGMAFPFVYLAIYLIVDHMKAGEVTFHWMVYTILYECIFGCVFGFLVGYIARQGIKFSEKHKLIDRESFLVFYFTLALFCAGAGSLLGMDDLLIGFAAGVGFSNDGWFTQKTEESHVSNVIDLLINLAYFVYFGTIIPWEQFNNAAINLEVWRLVVIAIFVLLFRRIPIMLMLKPVIPDVKTWREALFAGHFGPIGVGAIFVAILARSELTWESPVPLSNLPPEDAPHANVVSKIWPIVTFIVVASIVVHGSSIAVFTLGKRINTLTITMSYTAAPGEGPSWMDRLPRISSVSRSMARTVSDTDMEETKSPEFPPGTLPPTGWPGQFLRRQREEESSKPNSRASSLVSRRRRRRWDDGIGPGGPISQSAYGPQRRTTSDLASRPSQQEPEGPPHTDAPRERDEEREDVGSPPADTESPASPGGVEMYQEGSNLVLENEDGDVLAVVSREEGRHSSEADPHSDSSQEKVAVSQPIDKFQWNLTGFRKKMNEVWDSEIQKRKEKSMSERRHEPARAYQFGNTVIVEDEDGEVVKTYQLQPDKPQSALVSQSLKYMGMGGLARQKTGDDGEGGEPSTAATKVPSRIAPSRVWTGFGRDAGEGSTARERKKSVAEVQAEDDRNIRFTIDGMNQRLTKEDFIKKMQSLDANTRQEVVDSSTASNTVKNIARREPPRQRSTAAPVVEAPPRPAPVAAAQESVTSAKSSSDISRGRSDESSSPPAPFVRPGRSARDDHLGETPVERRRRLAVLASQGDDGGEGPAGETPAERRRRQAALGLAGEGDGEDSEDEGTERITPAQRRNIRFADVPERGRR